MLSQCYGIAALKHCQLGLDPGCSKLIPYMQMLLRFPRALLRKASLET